MIDQDAAIVKKRQPTSWLELALCETAAHPHPETLETFRRHLDPAWIEQALELTGTVTLRKRRLPAEQVVWLVLGMALMRDRPIQEVVRKLELALPNEADTPVACSAIAQARQRVGEEPLRWLFEHTGSRWAHRSARQHAWRDLALYGVDGTCMRVADSEVNRAHFGGTEGPRGDSGYPLVRIVTLMALRSHLLAAADIGPYREGEHALASALWDSIAPNSLTIMDRGFFSAAVLLGITRRGENRQWLLRIKSSTKMRVLKSYGPRDKLVELTVSKGARRKDPSLPKVFVARAISHRRPDSDGEQWLLTSLIDPAIYPASEIVDLYHERWELELGYDEIKTHMLEREESVRSRTVSGVMQELWGILLAFNLVRLEMTHIAEQARVSPSRISFLMALRWIRDEWLWCAVASPGSVPAKLQRMREKVAQFVLPPRRSERRYPRVVKIKMSKFKRKSAKTPRLVTN
jgi:hypothetical protein